MRPFNVCELVFEPSLQVDEVKGEREAELVLHHPISYGTNL